VLRWLGVEFVDHARADRRRVGLDARRADTPPRNPILNWDLPKRPEPLPRFLDDTEAAKFMAAARTSKDPRDRLIAELLALTGMRSGELTGLDADAVVRIGAGHWLRIPIGKLRNDRYVPLHPQLVDLLTDWTATNLEHIRATTD
jgi:integrase